MDSYRSLLELLQSPFGVIDRDLIGSVLRLPCLNIYKTALKSSLGPLWNTPLWNPYRALTGAAGVPRTVLEEVSLTGGLSTPPQTGAYP